MHAEPARQSHLNITSAYCTLTSINCCINKAGQPEVLKPCQISPSSSCTTRRAAKARCSRQLMNSPQSSFPAAGCPSCVLAALAASGPGCFAPAAVASAAGDTTGAPEAPAAGADAAAGWAPPAAAAPRPSAAAAPPAAGPPAAPCSASVAAACASLCASASSSAAASLLPPPSLYVALPARLLPPDVCACSASTP